MRARSVRWALGVTTLALVGVLFARSGGSAVGADGLDCTAFSQALMTQDEHGHSIVYDIEADLAVVDFDEQSLVISGSDPLCQANPDAMALLAAERALTELNLRGLCPEMTQFASGSAMTDERETDISPAGAQQFITEFCVGVTPAIDDGQLFVLPQGIRNAELTLKAGDLFPDTSVSFVGNQANKVSLVSAEVVDGSNLHVLVDVAGGHDQVDPRLARGVADPLDQAIAITAVGVDRLDAPADRPPRVPPGPGSRSRGRCSRARCRRRN